MNWWIKIISFIELKTFLEIMSVDKKYFKKVCEKIIYHFYDINKEISDKISRNSITNFLNMYPRITKFIISDLKYENEIYCDHKDKYGVKKYLLIGNQSNEFVFSDNVLPNTLNSNIPFTFYLKDKDNNDNFISSNIYYFEFYIDRHDFRNKFIEESLIVGFISAMYSSNEFNFGDHFSFGIDCFKNLFKYNDNIFEIPIPIIKGDTIGLGLEYIDKNIYKFIFTLNGVKIEFEKNFDLIRTNHVLKLGMNLGIASSIKFNFGEKPFMYDIESLINCSRVINISSNNFIQSNFSYDYINTNSIFNNNFFLKKKLVKYKKTNESIYNLSKKLLEANI